MLYQRARIPRKPLTKSFKLDPQDGVARVIQHKLHTLPQPTYG